MKKRRTVIRKYAAENTRKQNERDRELEAEMNKRIIEESALIRAEWDDHTRKMRTVGKPPAVTVTEATTGRGRHNGVECY